MFVVHLLLIFGLCLGLLVVWRLHAGVAGTTAVTAIPWCWGAILLWIASTVVNWLVPETSAGLVDQFWYWTGVTSLCPPIAVLGARRPTDRVWPWFVLAPLVVVLGWPAMTLWTTGPVWIRLQVESPVAVGFVLVTVMGLGNYAGTRLSLSVMLAGFAILAILLPFATFAPEAAWHGRLRETGVALMVLSLLLAYRAMRGTMHFDSPFDRVLWEFREMFGLVWSVRILERLQEQARRDQLKLEWTPHGVTWQDQSPVERERAERQIAHTLRWLLRRFVSSAWLDARQLPASEQLDPSEAPPTIDS